MRRGNLKAFSTVFISRSFDSLHSFPQLKSLVGRSNAYAILLMCLLILSACSPSEKHNLGAHGGCVPSMSPFLSPDKTVDGRITYCEGGDKWTGTLETELYPAGTQNIVVMLSGYPGNPGISIHAVNEIGIDATIPFSRQPRERWQPVVLTVPSEVSKAPYRIEVHDQSSSAFGWAGIGESEATTDLNLTKGALPIFIAVFFGNAWLIAVSLCLPNAAHPREKLCQGLLVGGILWLALFNAYVLSPKLGHTLTWTLSIAPFPLALIIGWRRHALVEFLEMQNTLLPIIALASLILWTGLFPFYWNGEPDGAPAIRWWPSLAIDAWLPMLFGDMINSGKLLVPMTGDWLSSDRPPLQTGLYLLVYDLFPGSRELVYQGISSWAQALVLLPLASFAARVLS